MDGITFSLVPVADEISPNRKVYRAIVKTNSTVDKEALAKALAEKTGQDISLANYFLDALNEILAKEIVAGYRVNLGQLSTEFMGTSPLPPIGTTYATMRSREAKKLPHHSLSTMGDESRCTVSSERTKTASAEPTVAKRPPSALPPTRMLRRTMSSRSKSTARVRNGRSRP